MRTWKDSLQRRGAWRRRYAVTSKGLALVDDWKTLPLGECLTLQRGFDLSAAERKPGSVPVVSSSGITGYHSIAPVRGPGVVTGRYGTIGEVFYVEPDFWPLNT